MTGQPLHKSPPLPVAPNADLAQQKASTPQDHVWVGASAGSGKTKVLTDRVLRLLLPDPAGRWLGAAPEKLLCITFTKAAAAEMALRVQGALGQWAVMPESELAKSLYDLTGVEPDAAMLKAARKLFADVLDCPGGLKIMTIHSFCQSVLARFPLEAKINPNFRVLDERIAGDLFSQSIEQVLLMAQQGTGRGTHEAFSRLSLRFDLKSLKDLIKTILKAPEQVEAFIATYRDMPSIEAMIKEAFSIPADINVSKLRQDFVTDAVLGETRGFASECCQSSAAKFKTLGQQLSAWLALTAEDRFKQFELYEQAMLTKGGAPRSFGNTGKNTESLVSGYEHELDRYMAYRDSSILCEQAAVTAALLVLAADIIASYKAAKKSLNALDFDDLIRATDTLLTNTSGKWVHFKLDGGIDHILMDEAQDTNPHQWSILERLSSEIFSGEGRETAQPRSLFVVGDKKQSIFSFQGADPQAFDRMQQYFDERGQAAGREIVKVPLEVSFRSTLPVLKLVDTVFNAPVLKSRVGLKDGEMLQHFSHNYKAEGIVELWPLLQPPKRTTSESWVLPFADDAAESFKSIAELVAERIDGWLASKEKLASQGREIQPGDILILVKTREPMVSNLLRELKARNLPVSGVDRMVLSQQIAVRDLIAAARFVRLPADSFSLACVLKSPLVGWDDDQLMALALPRGQDISLWQALQEAGDAPVLNWLISLLELGKTVRPFEFFETLLNRPCPAAPAGTGWRAMTARLGVDCIDPLEEFMTLCLNLEQQDITTLDDLMIWEQDSEVEIKRELEEEGSAIRIMTVHASKGLEAPIVILPDTSKVPNLKKVENFLWFDRQGKHLPLWGSGSATSHSEFQTLRKQRLEAHLAEDARLLYVALTRARDRLYIAGVATSKGIATEDSWYSHIANAFMQCADAETLADGTVRLRSAQTGTAKNRQKSASSTASVPAPAWLFHQAPAEPPRRKAFSPSRGELADAKKQVYSPTEMGHTERVQRGILTHKLFEILPDIPDPQRDAAAQHYIERAGQNLSQQVRAEIVFETLRVLRDPVFAPVFAAGSLAEVPITGYMGDHLQMNAQIDRLVILENHILIVDYKTNRPSPQNPANIPHAYIEQLRAYRDVLAQIYPNHLISCAILWTDQPLLMPVPNL